MIKRILIMGFPGSGKSTLSASLTASLLFTYKVTWLNADAVRERFNDWDFSHEGRIRQARRMRELADKENNDGRIAICDFVCPLPEMRDIYDPHLVIWMDTITEGRYEDTNKMFVPPDRYDFRITEKDADKYGELIADTIIKGCNE